MNKSFIFYESFIVAILNIRSEAVQLAMLRAIINYGLYGVEPEFNDATGVLDGMFTQIRYLIDAAQEKRAKRIANAKKGGAPKSNSNAQKQPKTTKNNQKQPKTTKNNQKQPYNVNVNDNVDVNVNVNDNVNSILPSIDGKSNSKADLTQSKSFKDVVLQYFNKKMSDKAIKQVRQISNQRGEWLMARVKEYGKDAIFEMIDKAASSDFLNGRNGRGFVATFDWLVRPNNFPKVIDGNYDNNNNSHGTSTTGSGYISRQEQQEQERIERQRSAYRLMQRLAAEDGGDPLPPLEQ